MTINKTEVSRMKKHTGGLAKFLNDDTQNAAKNSVEGEARIVYIDIDDIVSNPRNFYGLRDIDSLAGLIAVSRMVEPLVVCPEEDGKYMLLSGHRRRAAVQKLLDEGDYEERRLPCIVRQRRKITIPQEDGGDIVFDESDVELLHLIASNRGQRKERTMDEKLSEVKYLEPFARAVFAQKRQEHGKGMVFRKFFAEEILDISSSKLQRLESIGKLSAKVKAAVESGVLKETNAVKLAGLSLEEQDNALAWLEENGRKGTLQDVDEAIKAVKPKETSSTALEDKEPQEGKPYPVAEDDAEAESAEYDDSEDEAVSDNPPPTQQHKKEEATIVPSAAPRKAAQLMDIPDVFDNPQKEAEDWFLQERLAFYQSVFDQAKYLSENEPNERKAAQWGIRASVARYHIAELTEHQQNTIFTNKEP